MQLTKAEKAPFRRSRRSKIEQDGLIRLVVCPLCDAQPGQDCHSRESWYATDFHAGRKKAAGL